MTGGAAMRANRAPAEAPAIPRPLGDRLWEVDVARTIAIAMMVAYHVVYDIDLLSPGTGPDPFRGSWGALPEATGSLFLLLAGASVAISDERMRARGVALGPRLRRHARHALVVLGAGLLVVFATWLVFPERYVRFGILQAIGIGIIVSALTVRLRVWNLILGGLVVGAGLAIAGTRSDLPGLVALGFEPRGFSSVDYWPLLPWLGPMLIGLAVATMLYPNGRRGRLVSGLARTRSATSLLAAPGRHSLVTYLGHQLLLIPLVWAALAMSGRVAWWP